MAKLITGSICYDDIQAIPKDKLFKSQKGKTYINISIWMNDEPDNFGNDGSIQLSQSKEEREAKEKKIYIGNIKSFKKDKTDLPF
jgi:hypothetical protein